jgi:polysaccharide export outer membrane protein
MPPYLLVFYNFYIIAALKRSLNLFNIQMKNKLTVVKKSTLRNCPSNIYTLAILIIMLGSCTTARKSMYFPDIKSMDVLIDSTTREAARKVYPGDRVVVQIVTADQEGNASLNSTQKTSTEQGEGLMVDPSGHIEIPTLGKFYVKAKTPSVIRDEIQVKAAALYRDVTVYCTIIGRIIILNSIAQAGSGGSSGGGVQSVPLHDERLTIPEVLSGLRTNNLKLKNTWIIREVDGKRQVVKINLNSAEILKSPFFYLRNNDVIYLEPNRFNQFIEVNAPFRNLVGILAGFSGLALAIVLAIK